MEQILPTLTKKVVIITSQLHLPQIQRSPKTDLLLKHRNILLWISQNPIYTNQEKYMAFPYGINHHNVTAYLHFIKSNNINQPKSIKILNQFTNVHRHLPETHIRKMYPIFRGTKRLNYTEFLKNILNAEFVISTAGDRDDCYRHYESIGLNAIPISNINHGYKDIFGDNMVYSNAEEMRKNILTQTIRHAYIKHNTNILNVSYWKLKIQKRINQLRSKIGV